MFTNASMTLYLYSKEGYVRREIKGVYWEDVEQSTFLKTGQRNSCLALVIIPRSSLNAPISFTKGKDLVVKGICAEEFDNSSQATISQSLERVKKTYGALTLTSVDERLYGSASVQHYELSCK